VAKVESGTAKAVEATAKAAEKTATVIHDTGGYLREVVGDLPKNAVGLLGADWLGQKRIRNLDAMMGAAARTVRPASIAANTRARRSSE
jgi:hypothetical protein